MLRRMGNFRGWEWIIILLLALLLFGGFKKLPDAARGIGRSLRIFKSETKGLVDDDAPNLDSKSAPQAVADNAGSEVEHGKDANEAKNRSASA
jgi:sec-independent protein translocase protein TatA